MERIGPVEHRGVASLVTVTVQRLIASVRVGWGLGGGFAAQFSTWNCWLSLRLWTATKSIRASGSTRIESHAFAVRAGYSDAQIVVRSPSMAELAGHLSGLADELIAADLASTSSRAASMMGGKSGGSGGGGGEASRCPM